MFTLRKEKNTTTFTAKASTQNDAVFEIYDVIGADFFGNGITAAMMSEALAQIDNPKSLIVNINSPGGDLFEGVAIYNLLKALGLPIQVNVHGLAASAASLIAMAGDTITMQLGTQMMIHEAQSIAAGFANDFRKMADTLDSVTASAADLYVAKTGMSKDKILALMAAETWMNPEQAKASGFATDISEESGNVSNAFDLSVFKNTPIELKVQTKEVDGEDLVAEDFIYAGNPHDVSTWALPWHFSTEDKTKSHLRDALARFDQEEKIPESQKAEAHAKLVRPAKEHGIEVSDPANEASPIAAFDPTPIMRKRIELLKRG